MMNQMSSDRPDDSLLGVLRVWSTRKFWYIGYERDGFFILLAFSLFPLSNLSDDFN
jgi:hypothetical protein